MISASLYIFTAAATLFIAILIFVTYLIISCAFAITHVVIVSCSANVSEMITTKTIE